MKSFSSFPCFCQSTQTVVFSQLLYTLSQFLSNIDDFQSIFIVIIIISGRFGNGVLSYFTFLRWLFYLNIGISLLALTFIIIPTLSFKPILCKDQNITETSDLISNQTLANQTLALYNVQSCSYIVGLKTSKYNFNEDNLQNVIDFFQGTVSGISFFHHIVDIHRD